MVEALGRFEGRYEGRLEGRYESRFEGRFDGRSDIAAPGAVAWLDVSADTDGYARRSA